MQHYTLHPFSWQLGKGSYICIYVFVYSSAEITVNLVHIEEVVKSSVNIAVSSDGNLD